MVQRHERWDGFKS